MRLDGQGHERSEEEGEGSHRQSCFRPVRGLTCSVPGLHSDCFAGRAAGVVDDITGKALVPDAATAISNDASSKRARGRDMTPC